MTQDKRGIIILFMEPERKEREEIVYKADPFTFVFRKLDIIHTDIREIKGELAEFRKRFDDVNKRFDDVNKRFDDMNKRFDRLYIIVILNLAGIVGFLIKTLFFQ